jgi:hypothetical protein
VVNPHSTVRGSSRDEKLGSSEPPKAVPIKVTPEHYSLQFTVGELLSPSSTPVALVNRNRNGVIIVWNA